MPRWLARGLAAVALLTLVAVSLRNVAEVALAMWHRFAFPYDLEWMEGGQLYHAVRLMEGKPIYANCVDGFLPFPYPPVHVAILALAGSVFGLTYPVARLVSIGAFLTSSLALADAARSGSESRFRGPALAVVAVGGIAASYPMTGSWYDLIRVDSVYFALLVIGARLALPPRRQRGWGRVRRPTARRLVVSALFLAASVYTKQTAVFFLPWIALYALWRYGRRALPLWLGLATALLLPALWLNWRSDGFFATMMLDVMGRHPLKATQARAAALGALLFAPCLLLLPFATLWLSRKRRLDRDLAYWLGLLLSAAFASVITSAKIGAFTNNVLTICVLSWPVAAMVADRWIAGVPSRKPRAALWAALFALFAAWSLSRRSPVANVFVPTDEHRASAAALEELLGGLDGGVLAPGHSFLPLRSGHHHVQIHEQGYIDIMGAAVEEVDIIECFAKLDARWLVVDDATQPHMRALVLAGYRFNRVLPEMARTPVGLYTRPVALFERMPEAPLFRSKKNLRRLFDFEEGGYDGWTVLGEAFDWGPSSAFNGFQAPIAGQRGRFLADSFHPKHFDAAVGRLISPPFAIDRDHLGLRIGGGKSPKLRVELVVDGEVKRSVAGPGIDFEMLVPLIWDVGELRGSEAQLHVVDEEPGNWGHVLLDAVELFDATAAPAQ